MSVFKQYKRKQVAELRPVTQQDMDEFAAKGFIVAGQAGANASKVSISDADRLNGSPKRGDMIARNPANHADQWLVAAQYFKDNFEEV